LLLYSPFAPIAQYLAGRGANERRQRRKAGGTAAVCFFILPANLSYTSSSPFLTYHF